MNYYLLYLRVTLSANKKYFNIFLKRGYDTQLFIIQDKFVPDEHFENKSCVVKFPDQYSIVCCIVCCYTFPIFFLCKRRYRHEFSFFGGW